MSAQKQIAVAGKLGLRLPLLLCLLIATTICISMLACRGVSATHINIWKHRYPFYGGYGGGFGGGYGGGYGGYGGGYGGFKSINVLGGYGR